MTAVTKPSTLPIQSADWELREYEETDPLDTDALPVAARQVIANDINRDAERIKMDWLPDGRVRLQATQHVGVVSLPNGPSIEVRPKADANLLEMLRYSQGVSAETYDQETAITPGERFISALATLYEAELREVIQHGLLREYREESGSEEHIRGRLNIHNQLQRQGPQPTKFECTFDELTQNTVLNQGVLYATTILVRLLPESSVGSALKRHHQVLQRDVELRPVRPVELEAIELSRLGGYYEDLFRLTQLILQSVYAEELQHGDRSTFSLLVNMNDVFEGVIEEAVERVAKSHGMRAETQYQTGNLVWGGKKNIKIRPDIVLKEGNTVSLVGDAKWKIDSPSGQEPSNEDIYQLIAYQVAHDVPGFLFYPDQGGRVASKYRSSLGPGLELVEVPTSPSGGKTYPQTVESKIEDTLFP